MKPIVTPNSRWLWLAGMCVGAASLSAQTAIFNKSFETDGAGSRYTVENPSDDGSNDYFGIRELGSAGTRARGTIDGNFMWSIRDLDADGTAVADLASDEGRITWTEVIDISDLGNFAISVIAAQGWDEQEFDNVMSFQIRIDGGEWRTVGGFRGLHTNSPSYYFQGDLRTIPEFSDPRLTGTFREWSWDVFGTGSTMEIRMYTNMNGGSEENHFDNLTITAESGLNFFETSTTASLPESAGSGAITVTLPEAAPSEGLTISIANSDVDGSEVVMPTELVIPAGASSGQIDFTVLNDLQFDADELVSVLLSAPGYAREQVDIAITNLQSSPNLVINEVLPILNDVNTEDLAFDANNDGVVNDDDDQFIEIINMEDFAVDMSGWTINDELAPRHVIPDGTVLEPGGVLLVFSAGDPRGVFGGALIQVASLKSINFDEDGDVARIVAGTDLQGNAVIIDSVPYAADIGETYDSIQRVPELTGTVESFVDHPAVDGSGGALWSPGTRVDGSFFFDFTNELTLVPTETEVKESGSITVAVNLGSVQINKGIEDKRDMDKGDEHEVEFFEA